MTRHCQNSLVSLFSNRWSLCSAVSPSFRLCGVGLGGRGETKGRCLQAVKSGQKCRFWACSVSPACVKSVVTPPVTSLEWNPESPRTTKQLTVDHPHPSPMPCEQQSEQIVCLGVKKKKEKKKSEKFKVLLISSWNSLLWKAQVDYFQSENKEGNLVFTWYCKQEQINKSRQTAVRCKDRPFNMLLPQILFRGVKAKERILQNNINKV